MSITRCKSGGYFTRRVAIVLVLPSTVEQLKTIIQKPPLDPHTTDTAPQQAVKTLEAGLAITKPVRDRWRAFRQNALNFALQEIRETGASLEEVGAELKALRSERESGVRIEDFDRDSIEKMIIDGRAPPRTRVPRITSLNFNYFASFDDITPLRGLKALQELSLRNTLVSDLAPLSGLTRLAVLDLTGVYTVSDLGPLARLNSLQVLSLAGTNVRSISPVASLPNLHTIYYRPIIHEEQRIILSEWQRTLGKAKADILKPLR